MDNIETLPEISAEQRILEAARRVFTRKGFDGARMQEIADEAGINKALVHYYYRSKEKLFAGIFREAFSTMLPAMAHVFLGQGTIGQKIEVFVEKYLSVVLQNPFIPLFVLSEMNRNPDAFFNEFIPPELKQRVKAIEMLFEKGVEIGEIADISPRHLMINIMALCVFPFVARPMLQRMLDITDPEFEKVLAERKQVVSQFILNAITPKNKE
jgi:TetR/AcrR family transcriptional regulator